MSSHVTTHVLDSSRGRPAAGVAVTLESAADGAWSSLASSVTDDDGRAGTLGPERLEPGTYRLTFATGAYYARLGVDTFYPEVTVSFTVHGSEHYHVPVLLSPFAYSTYRGS